VNYVKVESSQIAEVGFGEGHYGPETLGIIFNPSKKQLAANLPGSEYHYGGVTSRTYQTIVAAPEPRLPFSEIKSRADLYPYVKVEADPTEPNGSTPTATVGTKTQADGNSIPIGTTDILSPGSALALIDSMADDILFTPGAITDAQLAAGRQWYLTEAKKYDISTEPKRTELKRFARPLQKLRTGIEARAKELTGATKRKIAAIDAEKRRLVQIVGGIEDEVLRPLTEWESKEMTRVDEHAEALKAIRESILYGATETVTDLTIRLAWLEIQRKRDWQEFAVPAEHSINEEVSRVERLIDLADARDKEQSELAKLRSDAAARADADRLANAAKEAREQAERESKAAVEYAEQKRLAAEQETKRQAELAEQRAIEAAAQAKRDQEQAIENERMRVADIAEGKRKADEARAADKEHRTKVNYEAASALVSECQIDEPAAYVIIEAIAKGIIPHLKIEY
jgi:hypothetical protein